MPQQEQRFSARRVDTQFDQVVQSEYAAISTPNEQVVEKLQSVYAGQIQQEEQSIERMRQRLAVAVRQQEQQEAIAKNIGAVHRVTKVPEKRIAARFFPAAYNWPRGLEQGLAVLLVLVVIAGWLVVSHLPHSSSGSPAFFSDASAPTLGEPIIRAQGNIDSVQEWSPDSRTFVSLQTDPKKQGLQASVLNIATRQTSIYPVLDASWNAALNANDPFQILMGRYLVAARAEGTEHATLVIWDITGRRAVSTQTIAAKIGHGGQVLTSWIAPSKSEQKFAMYTSDGDVAIWDVANGQKLITCEGKTRLDAMQIPRFQWYDHDQNVLLSSDVSMVGDGQVEAWNTSTGKRLINLTATGETVYSEAIVAPNSRYLAVSIGHLQVAGSTRIDTLEVLDAGSGQILHSYPVDAPQGTGTTFSWLFDSQSLLTTNYPERSTNTPPSSTPIYAWNVFTNQKKMFDPSLQGLPELVMGGQYLILRDSNEHPMEIWRISDGHKIATLEMSGGYGGADTFFYAANQKIVSGKKGNFDIWDLATGELLYKYHGATPFSIDGVSGSTVFWSPDGKYLTMIAGKSVSIGDGSLAIWRVD